MNNIGANEVCITGIGVIMPFACGWSNVYQIAGTGDVVYEPWADNLEPPYPQARLGLVKGYPKERYFSERQMRLMDRAMTIASTATGLALEDAGLDTEPGLHGQDVATIFASMRGEMPSLYRFGSPLFEGSTAYNPALFPMIARNITCGRAAIRFGLKGWSSMISCGEISGMHALARGVEFVSSGRAPIAVVSAYEVMSKFTLHQVVSRWRKYGVDPSQAKNHADVPVEGACVLILESLDSVRSRGVTPYAVLGGVSHGYLQGDVTAACERAVSRHLRSHGRDQAGCDFVAAGSGVGGPLAQQFDEAMLAQVRQRFQPPSEVRTRHQFGDAAAQSVLMQVACVAQGLKDQRMAPAFRSAGSPALGDRASGLIAQVTDRRAYGLASMRRWSAQEQ